MLHRYFISTTPTFIGRKTALFWVKQKHTDKTLNVFLKIISVLLIITAESDFNFKLND